MKQTTIKGRIKKSKGIDTQGNSSIGTFLEFFEKKLQIFSWD